MDKGIYCLVFWNPACTIKVGALGPVTFREGWHIYVGSALGSGGLARLGRHVSLSRAKDRTPKWHVDYLSTSPRCSLLYTVHAVTEERLECRLAGALGDPSVPSFGCSDCRCNSHLFWREIDPHREITEAFRSLGLDPVTTTIMSP
ncbi:GIY-YIG nuclease family protein [Methanoregula sp.]|uniref:GIY-YIG nuclease family protein n=1 Tax=Methanoregula sp. TaxID=2052170 RepID=UPI00236AF83C|nr:GIY-YIG nuclease family protein [Methanoregula sp.]MDD1686175.1 GIY-YIG nuclease family protein [Methanoregula sp.]